MAGLNVKRQDPSGGILGGVGSLVSSIGNGVSSVVSGVGASVSSGLGDLTSAIPTTTATTASTTSTSASVTTSAPASSVLPTFSSLSTSTSSSSLIDTHASSSISTSTDTSPSISSTQSFSVTPSVSASVFTSTSDGVKETITAFVTPSAGSPSSTQTPSSSNSGFLSNKPLEGFVFALCGIVGIVIIIVLATFFLRRSRRRSMINEALSYEPTTTHGYSRDMERGLAEKRNSYNSVGSSGGPPIAPGSYYAGKQAGYGYEREYPAHAAPSPNPVYDATRAYGSYSGTAYGDAMGTDVPAMPVYLPSVAAQQSPPSNVLPRVPVAMMTSNSQQHQLNFSGR